MSKLSDYRLVDEALNFNWVVVVPSKPPFNPTITTLKWMENPRVVKKELTEKQLFNNVKKELRKVVNRTSAI